ncbi:MAG TPA: hypothetical protein PK358_10745 [Spirochaetota bacterium]|nr:hypothetical protein [Spirochaetota bacterium]HPJ35304.1 hypothetical protein [Spirochaetota bacterium]
MKYIIPCPHCGESLRFPLDKGKIKIRCHCGYETVIDPDDTSLYRKGRFDLKPGKTEKKNKASKNSFNITIQNLIRALYNIKYSIQNLKHMPDRERNRIMLIILLPLLLLAAILYVFLGLLI